MDVDAEVKTIVGGLVSESPGDADVEMTAAKQDNAESLDEQAADATTTSTGAPGAVPVVQEQAVVRRPMNNDAGFEFHDVHKQKTKSEKCLLVAPTLCFAALSVDQNVLRTVV